MKAGRELDALVAEKVMGIELCHHELHETRPTCKYCHLNKGFWQPKWGRIEPPRHYSTDIAAAWEIVERLCNWDVDDNMLVLKGQGPDLEKKKWPNGEAAEWWEAEIGGTWGKVVSKAETAPHAICLAALKAKEIDA